MLIDRYVAPLLIPIAAVTMTTTLVLQSPEQRTHWNSPVEPFRVIGNIHYVGAAGVSAFLIVTPDGSLLLDGDLPETAPQIAANIATLGFRLSDVRFLLNSHAHFDHSGGLAELKRLSGALSWQAPGTHRSYAAGHPTPPPSPSTAGSMTARR